MMTRRQMTQMKKIESPETLLEMAENEENLQDALWFAKRARHLDPNNLDAERIIAGLSAEDDAKLLRRYEALIARGDLWMEEHGYMAQKHFGHYWEIPETQPYVRLRFSYCWLLYDMGIFRRAIVEAEELLWLCAADTPLDVRGLLLTLYALLGETEKAETLCAGAETEDSLSFLPLSVLYFREGNLRAARSCIQTMLRIDPGIAQLYTNLGPQITHNDLDIEEETDGPLPYTGFTYELFMMTMQYIHLYLNTPAYFLWGYYEIQSILNAEKKKEAKNAS